MSAWTRWALATVLASLAWWVPAAPCAAHDLQPGAVALREVTPDLFRVRVTPAQDGSGRSVLLHPVFPEPCTWHPPMLSCPGGLPGSFLLPGLAQARVRVIVHARFLDDTTTQVIVAPGEDRVSWRMSDPEASRGLLDTSGYLLIGVEHILFGPDHLLFVLGLLLVARGRWHLLAAITGFTLAHSVTLAVTVLGWFSPPMAATEWIIAASILLMVHEALRERPGLTGSSPWAVSSVFGLVHGFGFAGALLELGLPEDAVLPALFWFNVGVEAGQLLVVAVALVLTTALQRLLNPTHQARARLLLVLAMGLIASWWTVERFFVWCSVLA